MQYKVNRINGSGYEEIVLTSVRSEYTYNEGGYVSTRTDYNSDNEVEYWEAFAYIDDHPDLLIAYGNSNRYEEKYFYNEDLDLIKVECSTGLITTYEYYHKMIKGCGGLLKRVQSSNGKSTFYTYYENGKLKMQEEINGNVCQRVTCIYNEFNEEIQTIVEVIELADVINKTAN